MTSPSAPSPSASADAPPPPFRKGDLAELDVADLAFGGRALARAGGYIVFIDGALPGDRVEARVYRRKPHYAEARTERIVTPSPDRVPAVCSHTDICGGCRMQDLAYEV